MKNITAYDPQILQIYFVVLVSFYICYFKIRLLIIYLFINKFILKINKLFLFTLRKSSSYGQHRQQKQQEGHLRQRQINHTQSTINPRHPLTHCVLLILCSYQSAIEANVFAVNQISLL